MRSQIDLRSDALSCPTEEMYEAMRTASTVDDVFDRNETMNELQQLASSILGKEDALLVSSGCMANLIATLVHTRPGDGVVADALSHVAVSEPGIGAFSGVYMTHVVSHRGLMDPRDVERAMDRQYQEGTKPRLLVLENTHNLCGGIAIPLQHSDALCRVARSRGAQVHLDGARLFNASIALQTSAKALAVECDSVMISLSKGLCAPSGAVLAGSSAFISRARQMKKWLGGSRQDGMLAAAGIVALRTMLDRLSDDHKISRLLADLLAGIPNTEVSYHTTSTNLVFLKCTGEAPTAATLVNELHAKGILVLPLGEDSIRMAIYRGISEDQVRLAAEKIRDVINGYHAARLY